MAVTEDDAGTQAGESICEASHHRSGRDAQRRVDGIVVALEVKSFRVGTGAAQLRAAPRGQHLRANLGRESPSDAPLAEKLFTSPVQGTVHHVHAGPPADEPSRRHSGLESS